MSNSEIIKGDWRIAVKHCNTVCDSLVFKIGQPGKAVIMKIAALHAALISYNTGIRTQELYEGMLELKG